MILKWIDNLGKKICKGLNTPSPISPKKSRTAKSNEVTPLATEIP
jgi:hypothetical protein